MREISGDTKLNFKDRIRYLSYNFTRGISGQRTLIYSTSWSVPESVRLSEQDIGKNPDRVAIDYFIEKELPKIIPPSRVSILDIGCRDGYVRKILERAGYRGYYFGTDIAKSPKFDSYNTPAFEAICVNLPIEELETNQKFDIVLSVTVLEHIKNDEDVVTKTYKYLKPNGIQVHLVPGFWSLFLYLFHGYRQYNPRRIKSLFRGRDFKVYRLGGLFSFLLNLFAITIPSRFLRLRTGLRSYSKYTWYDKMLAKCTRCDKYLPICFWGYAIIAKQTNKERLR